MTDLYFSLMQDNFLMLTTKKNNLSFEQLLGELSKKLKIKNFNTVLLEQIHSNNILYADTSGFYKNHDGIILSSTSNLIPVIVTADCIPMFIYDKVTGSYGLIHCGWRGVVDSIHIKALDGFIKRNSKINDINIYLGPSIQGCCYEIGDDIISKFNKDSINHKNHKKYLNLFKEISSGFIQVGLDEKNINYSNICTYENNACYSYRRNGHSKGRMYSMMIKK